MVQQHPSLALLRHSPVGRRQHDPEDRQNSRTAHAIAPHRAAHLGRRLEPRDDRPEHVGSLGGRSAIKHALASRQLQVATQDCPHRELGLNTIDHIAIPCDAQVLHATRVLGQSRSGERLSDHDAYIIEIALA